METVRLGQITSPVGIKGEIRVYPYTDEITRFSAIKNMMIEGETESRAVEKVRYDKNMVVLKLSGIDDRNTSENLRNKYLVIPRDDMYEMPEGTYIIGDIVGSDVYDESGNSLGKLLGVIQNSSQDLYKIGTEEKNFLLPAVKEFILNVNLEEKKITVHIVEGLLDL